MGLTVCRLCVCCRRRYWWRSRIRCGATERRRGRGSDGCGKRAGRCSAIRHDDEEVPAVIDVAEDALIVAQRAVPTRKDDVSKREAAVQFRCKW